MNNKTSVIRDILFIVLFVAVFILIQWITTQLGAVFFAKIEDIEVKNVFAGIANGKYGKLTASISVISSLLTVLIFRLARWVPMSRKYLLSHPWGVFFWAVLLSLGSILPSEWLSEVINLKVPTATGKLFEGIMKEPWGYAAVGLLVPVAEEVVFRGGVLGKLLDIFGHQRHWIAIVISALVFGVAHFNLAQGVHAFVIGLLLGWMYYRTGSILPGIVFHWVNNSVAYFMFNLMPQMADGKLIDLFHGSQKMMIMGLLFSLCILIPSILQLALRMHKADEKGKTNA